MQAKIYLSNERNMERYGLHFEKGVALTDNEYLIEKLEKKGLKVEIQNNEIDINSLKVDELRKLAMEKGIEVPEKASKKELLKLIPEDKQEELDKNENEGNESPEDKQEELDKNDSIPQE